MNRLPLFLDLIHQPCLVIGGGDVAARKIGSLVDVGARVTVVAPMIGDTVAELAERHGLEVVLREFEPSDVRGRLLVIAATDDAGVNRAAFTACRERRVLINTVDDAALSTAIFPSIVDRGPVTVAVSTGGASPTLARRIREQVETLLPATTGRLAEFLRQRRARVREAVPEIGARRRLWDDVLDGNVPAHIAGGDEKTADAELERLVAGGAPEGFVSLVGAGPGDPDLLTLKALRTLQRADVVYYDNLVSAAVLELCRRDAKRVYVGKRRAFAGTRQADINALLLADAQQGLRVARLKGGDPFIFGRGGEEIETLRRHGIGFEVIPGITAALGCAAYAGIPLTHRDWAQSVRFVTGHLRDDVVNLDWPELAKPDQTLVVYMGLAGLRQLSARLIEHGMDPETPSAMVSRGTMEDQAVVTAPISRLARAVEAADLPGPTTTIIGRVVDLRAQLGGSE
ncbi:MAG: siroheme synthase CysG [Gammaproteobacteria bacterium]|nr:siroheme synthase CysG [Gammaproteobacteria bacterium]MDE0225384.1 siroheme synthase CysG [Gammaproteobacteria bacterium]